MYGLTITESVAAPPERVFGLATDLAGCAERVAGIDSVEVLTDGPFAIGTRWRETRTMMGKRATEEMWITALEPGRSYTAEAESCGCHYTSVLTCEPDGEGTRLSLTFEGQPLTLTSKLLSPLGWLMKGQVRSMLAADLADLRRAAEA